MSHLDRTRRFYRDSPYSLVRNDRQTSIPDRHWTDVVFDEALRQMEKFHKKGRPFFLNIWPDAPHTPYEPTPEPFMSWYKGKVTGDKLLYRSMVSHLDAGVGRILTKLRELGIADNTLVVFISDNGPSHQGSPGPWTGGKADLHEGGIRVPFLASWPGRVRAGAVSDGLAHGNDLLPTFCSAAGVKVPGRLAVDGCDLLPLLEGGPPPPRGTVFWQMDLYTWYPQPGKKPTPYATEVVRHGDWKLMARNGRAVGLFNLAVDPGERTNVLERELEVARELTAELHDWLRAMKRSRLPKLESPVAEE
jgi:N-acetylgalactosamine-6-sulfatase